MRGFGEHTLITVRNPLHFQYIPMISQTNMALELSATPAGKRQPRVRSIPLQHRDCSELHGLGVVRAAMVSAARGWRQDSTRLFHCLLVVRRGQFQVTGGGDEGSDLPRLLDPTTPGIFIERLADLRLVAIGDQPPDQSGTSHEVVRLQIDAEQVRQQVSLGLPALPARLLGDACSGLALTSFDDDHTIARQAWVTAAATSLRTLYDVCGIVSSDRIDPALRALLVMVNDQPDFPWNVAALGRQLGCSETHVGRRFAAAGLASPMREIAEIRMRRAERFLRFTDHSQAQIARLCGFANSFSFSRAFSRRYRFSPSAYRRRSR